MDGPEIYLTACELALEFHHHPFDTLYHAVALNLDGAVLVTADKRCYKKAHRRGQITLLAELELSV